MSKEHLKPVQKGQVLNPWGRKGRDGTKGMTSKTLKELLETKLYEVDVNTGRNAAEVIIEQVLRQASRGDLKFIDLIWDRIEGKATTMIEQNITGDNLVSPVVLYIPKREDEENDEQEIRDNE